MADTSVGALYRSSDPRHGGAEATIGGVVVRTETNGQRHYCGLTLGLVWDGQPKIEREPLPSCFPATWSPLQNFPVLERGEGEVVLAPLEEARNVVEDVPVDNGLYREMGPATAHDGESGEQGLRLGAVSLLKGIPVVSVELAGGAEFERPRINRLSSGEEIRLGETEPEVGGELYVATVAGWEALPRCVLGEDVCAYMHAPYMMGLSRARRLKLTKPSGKCRHFRVIDGTQLFRVHCQSGWPLTPLQHYPRETWERGFSRKPIPV